MAAEQPEYTVIRTDGRFQLRRYEPYIVGETVVEDEDTGRTPVIRTRLAASIAQLVRRFIVTSSIR